MGAIGIHQRSKKAIHLNSLAKNDHHPQRTKSVQSVLKCATNLHQSCPQITELLKIIQKQHDENMARTLLIHQYYQKLKW
jgi:hypothetical protein